MRAARQFLAFAVLATCCCCALLYSVLPAYLFDPYSPKRASVVHGLERDAARAHEMGEQAEWNAEMRVRAIEGQIISTAHYELATIGGEVDGALSMQSVLLVALVVTISAAGGIGGGGVLVPVLMLSEEMGPHGAIPLSKLTIFGNAVCQLALNWRKVHPLRPDRPLIDYDTTLMLEPPTLLGTVIGVLLNRMTPKWLIALLLLAFLVVTTWRTSSKALSLYGKESAALAAVAALTPRSSANHRAAEDAKDVKATSRQVGQQLQVPWAVVRQLALVWCLILSASMARRRAGCGTLAYWAVLLGLAAAIAVVTRKTARNFLLRHTARVAARYEYCEGDVIWDDDNVVRLPIGCVLAGVMAGMLGVGGGMVMQPLMLEIGLLPVRSLPMMLYLALSTSVGRYGAHPPSLTRRRRCCWS
jgi:uncharacterized membrane protein YfcA